jgi:hypothetical protein
VVKYHIVINGETYFLFTYDDNRLVTAKMVTVVDAFYWNEQIYLLFIDLFSEEISHAIML